MAETSLAKKLGIKPGQTMLVLNAPEGYVTALTSLLGQATIYTQADGTYDFVQAFVRDKVELYRYAPVAMQALKGGGLLWFTYPKKTSALKSDLSRDVLWQELSGTGMSPVTMIAIDETWSALRFRPTSEVGK